MKHSYICQHWIICALALSAFASGDIVADDRVGESAAPPEIRLELELTDGTRLIGMTDQETLPVRTPYAKMAIPLCQMSTAGFVLQEETVTLDFLNGDRLTGIPDFLAITLETLVGELEIGIEHIRRLHVRPHATATVTAGLILHYTFQGDTGTKVTDCSEKGHHGTAHNIRYIDLPGGGRAAQFRQGYIQTPTPRALGIAEQEDLAIMFWLSSRAQPPTGSLVSGRRGHRGFSFGFIDDRLYYLHLQTDHWAKFRSANTSETWTHLALTRSEGGWQIFENGIQLKETLTKGWPLIPGPPIENALRFGTDYVFSDWFFTGMLKDIRLYDRALEQHEIAILAANRP